MLRTQIKNKALFDHQKPAVLVVRETYGTTPNVAMAKGRDKTPSETVSASITRSNQCTF
jgi:hypothetical protein